MSPDTPAAITARLDGMEKYLRVEIEHMQKQLSLLADVPVRLERLDGNQKLLGQRVVELETEKQESSNKMLQWLSIIAVVLIGIGTIVINILQVAHA
jgi:hypothetical protein